MRRPPAFRRPSFRGIGYQAPTGSAWYPTAIAGTRAIWDAALGVTLSTADVSALADQSGNGNHLTGPGNLPLYNATDAAFNGQPTIEFDKANTESLTRAVMSLGGSLTQCSWWMVAKSVSAASTDIAFSYNGTALQIFGQTAARVRHAAVTPLCATSFATVPKLIVGKWDGVNASGYINGVLDSTPLAVATAITDSLVMSLGCMSNNTNYYPMKFAMGGIHSVDMSVSDQAALWAYVQARFAL